MPRVGLRYNKCTQEIVCGCMVSIANKTIHYPSHKHIDVYNKNLVEQLRQNNINRGKVYSIIGSFFGLMENVPFTKRSLRTLCGKLDREQADDDVRKTMEVFTDLSAKYPRFSYRVQANDEGRIKNLMWTNGNSRLQYTFFGDVVTFNTTYMTNLYGMPFGLFIVVNTFPMCDTSGSVGKI